MTMVVMASGFAISGTEPAQEPAQAEPAVLAAPERVADPTATRGASRTEPIEAIMPPEGTALVDFAAPPARPTTTTTTQPTRPTTQRANVSHETSKPQLKTVAATTPATGDIASIAKAQVGKAYRTGANGPSAFDCSGLVYYVFNQAGVDVPRLTSDGYFAKYPHITKAQLRVGDVVVYSGHIAVYVGDGKIVAASTPRGGVKHYAIDMPGKPIGYARIA